MDLLSFGRAGEERENKGDAAPSHRGLWGGLNASVNQLLCPEDKVDALRDLVTQTELKPENAIFYFFLFHSFLTMGDDSLQLYVIHREFDVIGLVGFCTRSVVFTNVASVPCGRDALVCFSS